ncbi:MAG: hypothetical protein BWY32_03006 [bacterium ADurb.Bin243]|nr:MAG: hypothetical protein BWY32_03006 [bacterium ADurb.Bin243]HOD39720.1 pilus assembly PilX N-terminal domain-containing protein [Candidatus Wallbacteria bacterium]
MLAYIKKSKPAKGFALAYVLFMVAVLFLLGYTVIMMMRQESSSSFNYLDASVAHFVAETGVEHALYVIKDHKYSDYIQPLSSDSTMDINKKFGAFASFADYPIPEDNPNDSWVASGELKTANIETSIQASIPEAKINHIKVKFDLQKKVDDNLALGIMSITCQGEYRGAKRAVTVQKQVELYRDLSVMARYAFAVNEDNNEQVIKARRWDGDATVTPTWSSKYVPQYLVINNGVEWLPPYNKTKAIIFGRKLVVELNETRSDFSNLSGIMNPVFKSMMDSLGQLSMIIKMHSKEVDEKLFEHTDSPMFKYVQHTGIAHIPLGANATSENVLGAVYEAINKDNWRLCEVDFPTGFGAAVGEALGGIIASTGGSRGNVDLTGHFPPIGWSAQAFNFVTSGFNNLFGIPNNSSTVHNWIYGDVKRRYGVMKQGWFSSFSGVDPQDEPYDFSEFTSNVVPGDIIGNNGQLAYLYDENTYKKIAARHNIIAETVDFTKDASVKGEKIPRLFDAATNEKFFENKKFTGDVAFFTTEKEYKKVVWRPFWGWADSSDQCVKELPWYNFSTSKNIFEAATQHSKYAINIDGVYFVDGDVLIEGYYKGRGAIVATGNIIIGGQILRHPDDGVFDPGSERQYDILRGANNCLQLIALGTKDAAASDFGVSGKIIFSPHPYDQKYYSGLFSGFQSYFSAKPYVRIDAYLYGKKGMMIDMKSRKAGFKLFSGTDDSFIGIFGNLTCQEINWEDEDKKNYYPDKLIINPFQKWIDKNKENFDKKYCTINYNVSRSDNYIQQRE